MYSQRTITKQEPYVRAFSQDFLTIWGATPLSQEYANLSYFRALTCFYGSEFDDIIDRRKLIFRYLENDFGSDNPTDTINELYRVLPTGTRMPRILRNLCSLYNQPPMRKYSEETSAERIEETYQKGRLNTAFRLAHQTAKLCNICAVMPFVRNGEIEVDVYPPDLFRVVCDPKDYKVVKELWIPICNVIDGRDVYSFKVWDDVYYTERDNECRLISQIEHGYGRIPAAFLRFEEGTDFYGGGMIELVDAALDDNKLCFLANNDVTYSAFSVWIATNFGQQNVSISPNKLLKVNNVTMGEGQSIPPSLENVGGNAQFLQIEELRDIRWKRALREKGFPESTVSSNPGLAASGVAMQIDRMELLEIRASDAEVMTDFENDFYPVFAAVVNHDLGLGLPESCTIGIDFAEPQMYVDPTADYDKKLALFEYGLLGAKDFLTIATKSELVDNDDDAIRYILENRRRLALLKTAVAPIEQPNTDASASIQ